MTEMSRAGGVPRILVVEDEVRLAEGIAENLAAEGYEPTVANDGAAGLSQILTGEYDLVILDVMMPEMDGFEVCRRAREEGSVVPILFLTARGGIEHRIEGLESGGDDYMEKPFHLRELLLRVKVILRRWDWYQGESSDDRTIRFGDNWFDPTTFEGVAWDGVSHVLTQKEALILRALDERAGAVVSREDLLEKVWGYDVYPSTRTIDNFILRLRKRFEPDPERPRYFHTVRGVGYRFTPEGVDDES